MWRVIVRLTYRHDDDARLESHAAGLLNAMGLQKTGATVWESPAVLPALAAAQMGRLLQALAEPQSVAGAAPRAALEHLSVDLDRAARRFDPYRVINDTDDDSFGNPEDYEEALRLAREAALDRPAETILITYRGWAIRHLNGMPDGQIAEEEISTPEEVDRTLRTLTPSASGGLHVRASVYRVINDTEEDCFGLSDDYETALSLAREAAHERPTETILITYKGWAIRHLNGMPDGQVAEEVISTPEEVDRTLRTLTLSAVGKQP